MSGRGYLASVYDRSMQFRKADSVSWGRLGSQRLSALFWCFFPPHVAPYRAS